MKVRALFPLAAAAGFWLAGPSQAEQPATLPSSVSAPSANPNQALADAIASRLRATNVAAGADVHNIPFAQVEVSACRSTVNAMPSSKKPMAAVADMGPGANASRCRTGRLTIQPDNTNRATAATAKPPQRPSRGSHEPEFAAGTAFIC